MTRSRPRKAGSIPIYGRICLRAEPSGYRATAPPQTEAASKPGHTMTPAAEPGFGQVLSWTGQCVQRRDAIWRELKWDDGHQECRVGNQKVHRNVRCLDRGCFSLNIADAVIRKVNLYTHVIPYRFRFRRARVGLRPFAGISGTSSSGECYPQGFHDPETLADLHWRSNRHHGSRCDNYGPVDA